MNSYIALMRGINVGAHRKVPMTDLRALCADIGLENPQTYIQSGNLLVDAKGDADAVRTALERAIDAHFGLKIDVIVRPVAAWQIYVDSNPFAQDDDALSKLVHLCLSRDPLNPGAVAALRERAIAGERIEVAKGALWIDFADSGVARSKLTPAFIDKSAGSPVTARNWNSVLKIAEMISERASG